MHIPAHHAERNITALCRFIKTNSFGILTTALKSEKHPTILSSHIPWVIDAIAEPDEDHLPILRGHIARANPQTQAIIAELTSKPQPWPTAHSTSHRLEDEVLVLFNGPTHHYITPKFYTQTQTATGKAVPTWNYTAAQAYGRATIWYDSNEEETQQYLAKQLSDLSEMSETDIMGFEQPWRMDNAPTSYIDMLSKAIIGIEIEVTKLEGRLKLSQDKPVGDRDGVVAGLRAMNTYDACAMAELIDEQSQIKKEQGK